MLERPQSRQRRPRPLAWPASQLTDLRHPIAAMAELAGVPMTTFIRSAVVAHLVTEHRRMFPEVATTPWDAEDEPCSELNNARRVAEQPRDIDTRGNAANW